jgi:NAD(P)-dependent dehydrogenase (short-subunit alcohol dehydrogenase family)
MRIIVIGSTGTIGSAVVQALAGHEVIGLHRKSTPAIDIEQPSTIAAAFAHLGKVDAVISCTGSGAFAPLAKLTDADFEKSLRSKLMGQVNVIRHALDHVNDHGSITVTSGSMAREPMPGGAAISMINAGIEGFALGAALEAPRGIRINAVAPPWIAETMAAMNLDASKGQPAATAAAVYASVVTGTQRGQIIDTRT